MRPLARYQRLAKVFVDYKMKRCRGRVLPLRIWLEPTNKCNLRCPLCPQSTDQKAPRGFMDPELYRSIVDQLKGFAYDLNLSHRGESLFHENIVEFINYAHTAGLKTRIHTNGTILGPDLSRELIASGLDFLSFSFDGFDKASYEASRVGAVYEQTLENIRTFLRLKKEAGSAVPFSVIQLIHDGRLEAGEFEHQKSLFLEQFRGLPLDKLYIKDPHNWGGAIQDARAESLALNQRYSPCTFCWYALTILWDGTAVPCPQDFFAQLNIGDTRTQSIREIWRGNEITTLRAKFVSRTIAGTSPCETCDRLFRKSFLGVPSPNLKEFLSENIVGYRFLKHLYGRQWKKTGK